MLLFAPIPPRVSRLHPPLFCTLLLHTPLTSPDAQLLALASFMCCCCVQHSPHSQLLVVLCA
jgi:hypothetical protein